jgi:hypothetical protein
MGFEPHGSGFVASNRDAVNWALSSRCSPPVRHRLLRHGVHVRRGAKYDIARFGAEFPRFPRQADLLIIVGTITERQGPPAPHLRSDVRAWVIAFGVCASTGGFYQNYSTMPGAIRSPATSTSPAARPAPSRSWTRWCCCRSASSWRGPQPGDADRSLGQDPPRRPSSRAAAPRAREAGRGLKASAMSQNVLDRLKAQFAGGEILRRLAARRRVRRAPRRWWPWRRSCATAPRRRWRCSST